MFRHSFIIMLKLRLKPYLSKSISYDNTITLIIVFDFRCYLQYETIVLAEMIGRSC